MDLELLLLLVAGVLAVLFALRWIIRRIGCNCHICGYRMNYFSELSIQDQREILGYFRIHEKRDPDTSAFFVCMRCSIVYDDFSGEKRSMDGDNRSLCKICNSPSVWYMASRMIPGEIGRFRGKNAGLIKNIECLRCERNPMDVSDCVLCDTAIKVTGCRQCHTLYTWSTYKGGKYKYLVPLTGRAVLKECNDMTGL